MSRRERRGPQINPRRRWRLVDLWLEFVVFTPRKGLNLMVRACVVLAAGQLLTEECWTPQIQALSPDYDLRLADHTHDDTIEAMAARLLGAAPDRFHLVGHAMGGF